MRDNETGTAEIAAQAQIMEAVLRFLDLAGAGVGPAWPTMDPLLRRCWAQQWLHANGARLSADGFSRDAVLAELEAERPRHPLWPLFRRTFDRSVSELLDRIPSRRRGFGTRPRVVAPDVELVHMHDMRDCRDGVWRPGTEARVLPILMRWSADVEPGGVWRVLNLGAERVPEPGWPPRLW